MKSFNIKFVGVVESSGRKVVRKVSVKARNQYAATDAVVKKIGKLYQRCIFPTFIFQQ